MNEALLFETLEPRSMFGADPYDISGSRVVLSTPDAYRAAAVADLDADGDQDVIVSAGPRIYTLLNNGQGRFTQTSVFRVTGYADSLAVGDFNNDGIADLAAFGPGTDTSTFLRVSFGDGDGTWTKKGTLKVAGSQAIVGNFDADAAREVAVVSGQRIKVFQMQTGTPGAVRVAFTTAGQIGTVAAGDLNLDGVSDLVVGERTADGGTPNPSMGRLSAVLIGASSIITQPVFAGAASRLDSVQIGNVVGSSRPEILFAGKAIGNPAGNARFSIRPAVWNERTGAWSAGAEMYGEDAPSSGVLTRDLRLTIGAIGDLDANGTRDVAFRRELMLDGVLNPAPATFETFFGALLNDGSGTYEVSPSDQSLEGQRRPLYVVANVDGGTVPDLLYMVLDPSTGGRNKLRLAQSLFSPPVF